MTQCKKRYAMAICALLWPAVKACFARHHENDSPFLCRVTVPDCTSYHAALLPRDLWAKIFAVLASEVASLLYNELQDPFYEAFVRQADLHRLRMVCRDFKAVFETQLVLSRTLVLPLALTSKSLHSWLSWAREHASSVQLLACGESFPYQRSGLLTCAWAALCCCHNSLAPPVISKFTSLTTCKICTTDLHNMDMTPLCTSLTLQQLELEWGEYTTSALPPHLTHLSLDAACVSTAEACLSVTSMRKLSLEASHLDMGSWDVFACSALQEYHCDNSYVADRSMVFDTSADSHITVPEDLTPLSKITVLFMLFDTAPEPGFDLGCFSALTALRGLTVKFSHGNVLITPSLTALQQLTSLNVCARAEVYRSFPGYVVGMNLGHIHVDIQWQHMQSLQNITVECHVFHFTSNIMALLKIRNLCCITLGQCTRFMPNNYISSGFFESLLLHLAKQRPNVCVSFNRKRLAFIFQSTRGILHCRWLM